MMDEQQQQDISDIDLIRAIRKRMLDEIGSRGDAERIVNNIYGGSLPSGGGVMDQLGGAASSSPEEDRDYFVDIMRQNFEPGDEAEFLDPQTGQPVKRPMERGGWQKRVHRFSAPKKKVTAE
jgi:hypothetical protein